MNRNPLPDKLFETIQLLDQEGNINSVITETVKHYNCLAAVRPELLEKICCYLGKCAKFISPQSVKALKTIPDPDLRNSGILAALDSLPSGPPCPKCGSIYFPVVTSIGLIREIRIVEDSGSALAPRRLQMLDQVGSPVFSALRKRLGRFFFWRPERFYFVIMDTFEKEDPDVEGASLCLPLALALYSCITGIPAPIGLSATGKVLRDGTIMPVENLNKKLDALKKERPFINRALLSSGQAMENNVQELDLIKVGTIDEAISRVFPGKTISAAIPTEINLNEEISKTEKQYDNYLIDTCIENTGELIRYLESGQYPIPRDKAVPALFTCYWRRGSCYCHKGDIKKTKEYLSKSDRLFENAPGLIRHNYYWNSRINFAVFLKDIFRYPEAEDLHIKIQERLEQIGGLNHEKGKNLSTLSQLYLAQGRFSEAETLQKKAIRLIREEERYRNYGYLAQVEIRAGKWKKAKYSLDKSGTLLDSADADTRKEGSPFYDLYLSEYLYRYGKTLKKQRKKPLQKLGRLISGYPEITWYVPGLIHKFAGLFMLKLKDEATGLKRLNNVIRFFDAQLNPVLMLLGVSVRVEKSLYFIQKGEQEKITEDVKNINKSLMMQKDIKRFFQTEITTLSRYLKIRKPGEKESIKVSETLISLQRQIPY